MGGICSCCWYSQTGKHSGSITYMRQNVYQYWNRERGVPYAKKTGEWLMEIDRKQGGRNREEADRWLR